ncbi:hypothetical protein O3G_MSEX014071 [Manduca sexta]|uniref:Uncharacterized protein n=1 Tax=Manduca sexta TaxID=7130 RepID=A0A921ZVK7_MANSE|nr:hypothetical protein O3G_MSEX014071 [Manduca sexta]KAG6463788.1 hypothetical protein O3G_MSEX014071 [Manduca sexta]KAG6463789.1 hypothetical protein O3G_MSEX014071 [Manduca sexta]
MLTHALYAWLVITAVAAPDDYQYCSVRYRRLCLGKGRHVACQFPEPGPGLSCENYTEIAFTDELKNFVTHYINRRRQRLASGNERVRGGIHLPKPRIMMLVSIFRNGIANWLSSRKDLQISAVLYTTTVGRQSAIHTQGRQWGK